jgi:hypothetical protein
MEEILKKLKEIDNKLSIMLSHCFMEGGKSFMDLYQETNVIEQTIIMVDDINKNEYKNIIEYSIKTRNFKIDKNYMVVDYEGKTYYIGKDILNDRK